jgi:glucose/mannose-6-phosphate isomerase
MSIDSLGFLDAVCSLPEQLAAAHEAAGRIDIRHFAPADEIDHIVIMGMGGSGIAGDVFATALNDELPVPCLVLKQYRVPAFVGPRTLAFAVSYSGDTEETVSMATAAAKCGARLVCISAGCTCRARRGTSRARRSVHSSRRCSSRRSVRVSHRARTRNW